MIVIFKNFKINSLVEESCMRCCRSSKTEKCFPVNPVRYLAEGSICIHGQCYKVNN